jgi:hypothetical protein
MCGPHFCSMIIEDALQVGLEQKAREVVEKGADVYAKV